jgi:hypothetical protein
VGDRSTSFDVATARAAGALTVCAALLGLAGCGGSGAAAAADGGDGAAADGPIVVACATPDAGEADAGTGTTDEFGPNAKAAAAASAIGRVNIYEVTVPTVLDRVDVYLRADLDGTRLTVAVQEATARTAPFRKLTDVQLDVGRCQGWATSGPLAIPLVVGRFYAIGFDPNQPVTGFVSTDADSLPIDGTFGRLTGSKTATSVSVTSLTWDKVSDKEYNRQRLATSPRAAGPEDMPPPDAGAADAGATDAGTTDGPRG